MIVDEAHHIRNEDTANHKAVRYFCENAEAAVFLTATPIQLENRDLFVLLNTLRPDLIIDEEGFRHMSEPNRFINRSIDAARAQERGWMREARRALRQAETTAWGQSILRDNPEFRRIQSQLSSETIADAERVRLITDIEALHTFAGILNRTRRRDIGEFTVRRAVTVEVELTPDQEHLHEMALETQAEIFRRLHGDLNVRFMMTTIRRQLASCLYGLRPFLEQILSRNLDSLALSEADSTESIPHEASLNQIQDQIETILDRARSITSRDRKLEALREIIRERQDLSNNKLMVFSSFRHTLAYLYEHLESEGFRVGMVHGGTPDDERVDLRNRFEKAKEDSDCLDVMLFSEVGCEGLDYQFCDCIVNYDLPWNPMRIEQRIGRIDRKGQQSERVTIYNLITPGTIDADIYERCLRRIGVFESALGGSEEILGEITTELREIAENFDLTEVERLEKLQQLADNQILLIQEKERLEDQQLELFGSHLPDDRMEKDVKDASSYWLLPESLQRLVTLYLQWKSGDDREYILGERSLKTLRLSEVARQKLLHDFQQLPRERSPVFREWENWLRGGEQHLAITFEADCATQNPNAAFIMPIHPLVKQASLRLENEDNVVTVLSAQTNDVPPGRYDFAIYRWQFYGIKEDMVLKPLTTFEALTPHLNRLLQDAVDSDSLGDYQPPRRDDLEILHQRLWADERERHRQRTRALAAYRRESLSRSHQARVALLREQLRQATSQNIRRMRHYQIANAEADYNRRLEELNDAMARADITAEPVAYGILEVEGR